MKVSVIVPVYNVEKYIIKCLESVKRQSFDNFECLIIDDGSKDNSIELAEKYVKDDNRFKIYHKENGGLSDARNYGINLSKGEYLFFLDSDDYIADILLADAYQMAKKYDSDIVCFDMMYVYEDGRDNEISSGGDFEVTSYQENKSLIFINNSANNKLYKRTFLEDKRFIKGMWYEDLAVVPTWLARANNVSHVGKALYYYVQRSGSISHSADERIFDIYKAIDMNKKALDLSDNELSDLYFNDCLVMTTLRIREIADTKMRQEFYRKNIELLEKGYPEWYESIKARNCSFKQKVVFFLLKHRMISLLDKVY